MVFCTAHNGYCRRKHGEKKAYRVKHIRACKSGGRVASDKHRGDARRYYVAEYLSARLSAVIHQQCGGSGKTVSGHRDKKSCIAYAVHENIAEEQEDKGNRYGKQ